MSISEQEVWKKLKDFMEGKSQRQAAKELGVSSAYLNDVMNNRRAVTGPAILKKLGMKKLTVIEKR